MRCPLRQAAVPVIARRGGPVEEEKGGSGAGRDVV
jgi:hypothetical protein